jgi:hypothetical protein
LLPSAVTSVTFPWKIMYVQDVIIWYSVVVASYIEGLLENMYRCVCVCVCACVCVEWARCPSLRMFWKHSEETNKFKPHSEANNM